MSQPEITQFSEYNTLNNKIRDAIPAKLENHLKLSLPRIASCGDQSSGKSSILTQMTGIRFPRNAGTCTRVPVELRLESRENEYKAEIGVKWYEDDEKNDEACAEADKTVANINETLARNITDAESLVDEIEDAIKKAQEAIIGVSNRKFSESVITITAFSPDLPNLTLVDLPGIIAHIDGDSNAGAMVENLYHKYLTDPATVLMAVLNGGVDIENQRIWNMISKGDPGHERTIGVITKADLIAEGTQEPWLKLMSGESIHMDMTHGWYVTKSLSQNDLQNTTQREALEREGNFFSTGFWREFSHPSHLGTQNLRTKMSALLFERMRIALPALKDQAERLLGKNRKFLKSLGEGIPASEEEKLSRLKEKIDDLVGDLKIQFGHHSFSQLEEGNTFYASVQQVWEKFKYNIRHLGPQNTTQSWYVIDSWDNLPKNAVEIAACFDDGVTMDESTVYAQLASGRKVMCSEKSGDYFHFPVSESELVDTHVSFISPEDAAIKTRIYATEEEDTGFRQRVKKRLAHESENRRLMIGERSTDVTPALCNEFIEKWTKPSRDLVDTIHKKEDQLLLILIDRRFEQFKQMHRAVRNRARKYLDEHRDKLWHFIQSVHDAEMKHKHTLNDHYFFETKMRHNAQEPKEDAMLQKARELTGISNYRMTEAMRKHLLAVGLEPENSFEKHIDDAIATVVAYHKCAYKRYVEYCHLISAKVFFDDFLDKMKSSLWNDVRHGTTLGALFSEAPEIVMKRRNAMESIAALEHVLKVLNETALVF
uniref:Dynamin-type G domain-containing protein n=1 Tax=Percolomonas cosmopolitus TaxID=63605 RepID=A0A7S1KNN6_9EUKA|mmetsp:Transcript_11247/g.42117  ORF Transcript_11247/g.42117 Transcript_11247/m.42117 type:complete len:769 (+) Transcript_11247:416-2722(+)|eukprot:CAMPEP_0117445798 /NCGR_PEP_ID=MMETSP0759-20121206/5989_1 /TAXON_ID=63605 /ORGANISM="Percolomonas cosmopolitus, Strain WS" /LENGTH=768 /DNA_ID=CAMNT_0005238001 /DNA_START=370 /DNA_END=2676 /DNA_ORIENTATION=+